MKTIMILLLLLAIQTMPAQLSVNLTVNKTNDETATFTTDQGRVYFDLVEENLRIYTEDEDGSQPEWLACNVSDIRSFKLTAGVHEQLLIVVTDIYHATKVFTSMAETSINNQGNEWIVNLSSGETQKTDLNLLRNIMVENIGEEESRINGIASSNTIYESEGHIFIKSADFIGKVNVFNLSGELLFSGYTPSKELEMAHNFPKGLYIITAGTHAQKIFL